MPEIGEVARIVHYLRKHLVGKKIIETLVQEDDIIYGKVGTSAKAFKEAMDGKTILDARQQGKYFYLVSSKSPHPVMHLGMTGWMKFSNDDSSYYKPKKEEEEQWPPRFWKFIFRTEGEGDEKNEIAFVDARRLARIRLVEAEGDQLRKSSPLKENGPDPVIDKDILTVQWLTEKLRSKKVPVKALLLDQANISGVGNWVADEVLYQARIHPEQYSNTFSDQQMKDLHDSLIKVCTTAVDTLSDQSKFPEDWIMKYRWDKGKKDSNVLPNGEKITHIKVGGRTSAVVLSRQKKTGPVAGDAVESDADEDESKARGKKRKSDGNQAETKEKPAATKKSRKAKTEDVPEQVVDSAAELEGKTAGANKKSSKAKLPPKNTAEESTGRRRSARIKA